MPYVFGNLYEYLEILYKFTCGKQEKVSLKIV